MNNLVTTPDGSCIFLRENLFRSVLGSDDDALRSDEPKATAFDLSGKWIVVAPVLKLAGDVGMSRVEVLYEDRLFGVVVVPPLVRFFLVEVREVGPHNSCIIVPNNNLNIQIERTIMKSGRSFFLFCIVLISFFLYFIV